MTKNGSVMEGKLIAMRIGFVFTNYNNAHYTKENVISISRIKNYEVLPVIIVDNNSNQSDKDELRKIEDEFANVKIIFNNENIGYFAGLNVGILEIRNHYPDIEHIVIGNNDLEFPSDFFDHIINKSHLFNDYPVICPNLVTLDGEHQNPHVLSSISVARELIWDIYYTNYLIAICIRVLARFTKRFTRRRDHEYHRIPQIIYQGYGACYILGPIFFKHFDNLWAPTFLLGEELFLSKQLQDKGLHLFYEPSIYVNHHDHASMSKLISSDLWKIARDSHKIYRKYVNPFSSKILRNN